jgi:hypothetical protein
VPHQYDRLSKGIEVNYVNVPSAAFTIEEYDRFDAEAVFRVLTGGILCAMFRDFASPIRSRQLVDQFLNNPFTRLRDGDATGHYLGAFHWGKDVASYKSDCETVRQALQDAFEPIETDPWKDFLVHLQAALLTRGRILRHARCGDCIVTSPLIRSWSREGDFSLVPHEDLAQCSDPKQVGFEIQRVANYVVCSANMCIANEHGGNLVFWNFVPTQPDRAQYGTLYTGGPYPIEELNKCQRLTLAVRPGDLYLFNGSFVHAVTAANGERVTVSSLLGFVDDTTAVMWT